MFEHEAQSFGESEDRVCRFAARIGEILDREKGAIDIVMPVDQKQFHLETGLTGFGGFQNGR
jgi:hypothetical protein